MFVLATGVGEACSFPLNLKTAFPTDKQTLWIYPFMSL